MGWWGRTSYADQELNLQANLKFAGTLTLAGPFRTLRGLLRLLKGL